MLASPRFRLVLTFSALHLCLVPPLAGFDEPKAPTPAAPPALNGDRLSSAADEYISTYERLGRFSGSVLITVGPKVILAKGYGFADRANKTPNTPATKIELGSITKPITAAAILKLESAGKLKLTDTLHALLPEYPKETGEKITVEHLLLHSSGIPSLGRRGDGLEGFTGGDVPILLSVLVEWFADRELLFEPGAKYRYNNSGYIALAAIIERASGMSYVDYIEREVLRAAGESAESRRDAAGAAKAIGYAGYAPAIRLAGPAHPSWLLGASGLSASVEDLHRFVTALSAGKIFAGGGEKAFAPRISCGGKAEYGYGWFIEKREGKTLVHHGGTNEGGFVGELYMVPEMGLTVIVLSNYLPTLGVNAPAGIADAVVAMALGQPVAPLPKLAAGHSDLRSAVGNYDAEGGGSVSIALKGNELWMSAAGPGVHSIFDFAELSDPGKLTAARAVGEKLAAALRAGEIEQARELMNETVRGYMTAEAVGGIRTQLVTAYGEDFTLELVGAKRFAGKPKFLAVLRAAGNEKNPSDIAFDIGEDGLVAGVYGLTLDETKEALADVPPRSVRLWPVEGGKFHVDGFNCRERDATIELIGESGAAPTGLKIVGQRTHELRRA